MTNPYASTISSSVPIAASEDATVVAEYSPAAVPSTAYQSEAALENNLIEILTSQGYRRVSCRDEKSLLANLRGHLSRLNDVEFTDAEWNRLLQEFITPHDDDVLAKTKRIQHERAVYTFTFNDGTRENIRLIDFDNPHNNVFEVLNQYVAPTTNPAHRTNRYDVTILINGLPIVQCELKKRGVDLKQAFNQIGRYSRDSFSTSSKLFDYVHVFVISNGSLTKYYSNTTRILARKSADETAPTRIMKSNSFKFTMWWSDAKNKRIADLSDFARTFLARRSLFNIIAKYCVLDTNDVLLIMRPYQIVATERIVTKVLAGIHNRGLLGTINAGGYIWHTTGSGKTLTSFKTAQLVAQYPEVAKVIFVVDRQDLDYQTMKEYDKFAKGAANGNNSAKVLRGQLLDDECQIIVTTIQKLNYLTGDKEALDVYDKHVVFIFDECHRSQFGSMHKRIAKRFSKAAMFGFTGTPIFHTVEDEHKRHNVLTVPETTEQVFGPRLHTYTIMDAIRDDNVLRFNIQTYDTMAANVLEDVEAASINREKALLAPARIASVVDHILDNFARHTSRSSTYSLTVQDYDPVAFKKGVDSQRTVATVSGFNAMMATSSIPAAEAYYTAFSEQMATRPPKERLKVATIFSAASGEKEVFDDEGFLDGEDFSADALGVDDKAFLAAAVEDYNALFDTNFSVSDNQSFQNYYRDLSQRMKNRELDLVIVVNMFLTGFDAPTLNTLYVDKNLRRHGLVQAFSRTNRILGSKKAAGNIVCYRNLDEEIEEAIARFGDAEAYNVVVLQSYDYYRELFVDAVDNLREIAAPGEIPDSEKVQRDFVKQFSTILQLINTLDMFAEFDADDTLSRRDFQDYQSVYLHLHDTMTNPTEGEVIDIVEDLTFEIALVGKYAVDVDYILELVMQLKDARGNLKKEDRERVQREVDSSPSLRMKSDLIDAFLSQLQDDSTPQDFYEMASKKFVSELDAMVKRFNLKRDETYHFVTQGIADGRLSAAGMGAARIMPAQRRFGRAATATVSRDEVVAELNHLLERFADIIGSDVLVNQ